MTGMAVGMRMGTGSVPLMALMMLPSALPAIVRSTRGSVGALQAPLFAGAYVGVWTVVALVTVLIYRPFGALTAGALIVGAGLYELTPIKRECRRRCRAPVRSGVRFGGYCFGSSIGLMVVLVALNPMSVPLTCAVAVVVLLQKLFPPHPAVDIPLALAIVAVGVAAA
jgi:predicted metal-binding membrane protein